MEPNKSFVAACRAVHIYLTMLGLLAVLLFSVTGFTLNHPEWFGAVRPQLTEREARVPAELLARGDALRLVEHLRTNVGITGSFPREAASGGMSFVGHSPHR